MPKNDAALREDGMLCPWLAARSSAAPRQEIRSAAARIDAGELYLPDFEALALPEPGPLRLEPVR